MRLIDADAMREVLHSYTQSGNILWNEEEIKKYLIDYMPTHDAEPVIYAYWDENFCCTNCHGDAPSDDTGNIVLTEYCPTCGAIMDEEVTK